MIDRILIKDHFSFKNVELSFGSGLSVFTGSSGAGKSVFMNAIMSVFGLADSEAKLIEADVDFEFKMDEYGIENEEINSFKMVREKSSRYFINSQTISKKNLSTIASEHIKYFSAKGLNELDNDRFLQLLDALVDGQNHKNNLKIMSDLYLKYQDIKAQLDKINDDEKRVEELKEFAKFEIEKIESVSPKVGEFDELLEIKKRLSKKDKIIAAWERASHIYEFEHSVIEALNISDIDSTFFTEAMNELRMAKDNIGIDELDDFDVEHILDRIEALNSIIKRYGSEEEALSVLSTKKAELSRYENISFEKAKIEAEFNEIKKQVDTICNELSIARNEAIDKFNNLVSNYLKQLYMPPINAGLRRVNLRDDGLDELFFELNGVNLSKISSGETNRLRLAFIAAFCDVLNNEKGVIILDEIDANLSGKEAMSIADVLVKISKFYQIFAISHQPQLSSKADAHFLVEKFEDGSSIKLLNYDERVKELARMISGEQIGQQAINFAKELLKSN